MFNIYGQLSSYTLNLWYSITVLLMFFLFVGFVNIYIINMCTEIFILHYMYIIVDVYNCILAFFHS